jgi:hypothetical protein
MAALKKQFFFVHIPKTAGTTMALTLARLFKWKKKLSYYTPQGRRNHSKLTAEYKNKFDLSYGHIPFNANDKIDRGIEYFTFFRTPREHLLSGYRHLKGDGNHGIKKVINVADYSLKDFLKKGLVKNVDNLSVRFLAGQIDKPFLEINENDLQQAIKNFDTYFHIFGLTEYFDESLVLLSDYMKWPTLYYVRENKSSYTIDPKELDEETEQLISRCTQYDKILYDHARQRFLKLMEEKKEVIEAGLIKLRAGNKKYKTILSLRSKASLFYSYIRRKLNQ